LFVATLKVNKVNKVNNNALNNALNDALVKPNLATPNNNKLL
jgi:hypothetical protein